MPPILLSPNVPKPHRLAFLAEAEPGSRVVCETTQGTRVWIKKANRDWTRAGESWETHQLAEVLWRLGGEQTLETSGDFQLSNLSPDEIVSLRREYSRTARATRGQQWDLASQQTRQTE